MQNAQLVYLKTIEGLLMDSEVEKALEALLDLDQQTQAGIRQDVVQQSGNFVSAKKEYQRGAISFEEYSRFSARTRSGLLELMKEIPRRVERDAKIRSLGTFQFTVPDEARLEKVIGPQNNLLRINWLEKALRASKAVCRVVCADGELGTGFLTKEGYIFTNNHVIPDADIARDARIEFNYEMDASGSVKSRTAYRLDASDFVTSTPDLLDFSRIRVVDDPANPLSQWGFVEFDPSAVPTVGEPVTIIQHPKGEDKHIALNANDVLSAWNQHLYYTADTEPGSSGSPVFNKDWKVVAIHHAGKTDAEGGLQINAKGDKRGANRGILFQQIFDFIKKGGAATAPAAKPQPVSGKESVSTPPAPVQDQPIAAATTAGAVPKFVVVYDAADTPHCQTLSKHLFLLKATKKIQLYNVHEAPPGEDLFARAEAEVAGADYVLVLITQNLFSVEAWFMLILKAIETGKRVIPVHIEKFDIAGSGLERLRALPTQNRSLSDFPTLDAAYSDIVAEIKKLVP
ncbi:MAG: trypsin-like peptidase domain-containing protein [Saprospiraceae bacterium]